MAEAPVLLRAFKHLAHYHFPAMLLPNKLPSRQTYGARLLALIIRHRAPLIRLLYSLSPASAGWPHVNELLTAVPSALEEYSLN